MKKAFSMMVDRKRRYILSKKINKIYRKISPRWEIPFENIKKHKAIWAKIRSKPNLKWYRVYSAVSGIDDPQYITEIDYYNKIEPVLNNKMFSEAYCDKNAYHRYIKGKLLPFVYVRNIQGVFYDGKYELLPTIFDIRDFIPADKEMLIIKSAVDTGGGQGVKVFTKHRNEWKNNDGEKLTRCYLDRHYGKNYLLQEYITQHPYYAQFNSSSINTIRLFTYRSVESNQIIPLQAVLRVGRPGSYVDNQAAGGVACGIGEDGFLKGFCINKKGERFSSINGISIDTARLVFRFHEILELGIELAKEHPYHRLLGFDFCVDQGGSVLLIEVNNRNHEINFFQMSNGPLFKHYTEEVIEYCTKNMKSVCFDYEV